MLEPRNVACSQHAKHHIAHIRLPRYIVWLCVYSILVCLSTLCRFTQSKKWSKGIRRMHNLPYKARTRALEYIADLRSNVHRVSVFAVKSIALMLHEPLLMPKVLLSLSP